MESVRFSNFSPRSKQRSEDEVLEKFGKTHVIASEAAACRDPDGVTIMDAKALYDSINNDQAAAGEDERSALEVAIIKESLICTAAGQGGFPIM